MNNYEAQLKYDDWSLNQPLRQIEEMNETNILEPERRLIDDKEPGKILDIGSGNGNRLFNYLSRLNIDFIGLEKFQRLVSGRSQYPDSIIIGGLMEIDVNREELNNVDCITILGGSLNGIFGLDNHYLAWGNLYRILPKGGYIIMDCLWGKTTGIYDQPPFPPQFFLSEKDLREIWNNYNLNVEEEIENDEGPPLKYFLLRK